MADTKKLKDLAKEDASVSKVNYKHLEKLIKDGVTLCVIKNTLTTPFVHNWNLELLPEDLEEEFDKYLEKKYVEYGKENLIGKSRMVAIFEEGQTVNFLDSFLTGKRYPVVLPVQEGKEEKLKSCFVLNPLKEVIVTAYQAESLRALEKTKRVWDDKDKGKVESDWTGFLIISEIEDVKDLEKYGISYVTSEDVMNTHENISEAIRKSSRDQAGIVKARQ